MYSELHSADSSNDFRPYVSFRGSVMRGAVSVVVIAFPPVTLVNRIQSLVMAGTVYLYIGETRARLYHG